MYWQEKQNLLLKWKPKRRDKLLGSKLKNAALSFIGNVRSKSILDIGCGKGKFVDQLRRLGANSYGIDPQINTSKFCKVGVAENLPFPNSFFNMVTILAALDHFKSLDKVVSEINRVLTQHGKVFLLQTIDRKPVLNDPTHLHSFTEKDLFELFKEYRLINYRRIYCFAYVLPNWFCCFLDRGIKLKKYVGFYMFKRY